MLQRRTVLLAGLAAATPAVAARGDTALPPALDQLTGLALETFDGDATTLAEHLRPGPAVVAFWASWCAPCEAEARHLANMRRRFGPERLSIVGLNVELVDNEAAVQRFLARTQPNYPQLRANMASYAAFGGGALLNLPRLYVFAADGRPVAAFGAYDPNATYRAIDRAIASVVSQ